MKLFKLASCAVAASLLFLQVACSNENKQEGQTQKMEFNSSQELLAENKTQSPIIYEIVEIGQAANGKITDFSFLDENGKKVSISSIIKDKYVFLNFWATWCPPCRAEIPDIIEIQNELRSKDLIVIGIALEREKTMDASIKKVQDFAGKNKINYMNFLLKDDLKKTLATSYEGIPYIPTTILVDKKGDIFEKIQGQRTKDDFLGSINKMMK